ncbi:MAG: BatA domain-containing protein, partial [Verrucomicrobiota bacterium]|nr:BatA domain-containing protein [Verrucomicrobiota bacterium]
MNIVLTNPAGFFALLGIPAVILIHFLQRQARVIPISTLFLLAHTQRESLSGRRFDRFTNSVPLWLQLLMVLLLTWLLVLPRYVRPASTQQVAIVLDSSASMSVFKDKLVISLREKLPPLQGNASRLQLYLFESAAEKPVIYAGNDLEEALTSLENWNPSA